jgi:hypothetical protein
VNSVLRPPYALFCDDSGGEDDDLRAVAAVSGPTWALLELERSLRGVLDVVGMEELKWTALRTRPRRFEAARAFLELAAVGVAAGSLRLEVLLWRPSDQGRVSRKRGDHERLRPLYARLWTGAFKAWPKGRWRLHPDQRTGMAWGALAGALAPSFGRGGLRKVGELSSERCACVQLADLLAGLCRIESGVSGRASRAWGHREALRNDFIGICRRRGLALALEDGLLSARHPRLNVRLLKRIPLNP